MEPVQYLRIELGAGEGEALEEGDRLVDSLLEGLNDAEAELLGERLAELEAEGL